MAGSNKNIKRIGIGLLAASFWYYFLRGVYALKIGLARISLVSISGAGATLEVLFYIYNPLMVQVLLRSISGTVQMMGVDVASINYPINRRILARGTTYIPVRVEVDAKKLGEAAYRNILTGNIQTLSVELRGTIVTGENMAVNLPIRKMWTYDDIVSNIAQ